MNLLLNIIFAIKGLIVVNKWRVIFGLVAIGAAVLLWHQSVKIKSLNKELANAKSNAIELANDKYNRENDNRVLTLKLGDLSHLNDEMTHCIDSLRSELKTAKNALKQAVAVREVVRDTIYATINPENISEPDLSLVMSDKCNFKAKAMPNDLTTIEIEKRGDSLIVVPDIRNDMIVYISETKKYRNERPNWFSRLFHWDWKKDDILQYEIINTNPLIIIDKARVVNIEY